MFRSYQISPTSASAERQAYLDEACAAAPEVRRRVEALLRAYEQAASFLEQPAVAASAATLDHRPIAESPGTVIGPYKLWSRSAKVAWAWSLFSSRT
jgi:hypothetical protein